VKEARLHDYSLKRRRNVEETKQGAFETEKGWHDVCQPYLYICDKGE